MTLQALLNYSDKLKEANHLLKQVSSGEDTLIYGVMGSQKSLLTTLIFRKETGPLLYLVESPQKGKEVFDDLNSLIPGTPIYYFPALEVLPFEVLAQSHETQCKRLEVLQQLIAGTPCIVITPLEALSKTLLDPNLFRQALYTVRVGCRIKMEDLMFYLSSVGYQRVERVEDKGQVSLRGGILDVFSPVEEYPYRIEFFDEEVDSIRCFTLENQRSAQKLEHVTILPTTEFFLYGLDTQIALRKMEAEAQHVIKVMEKKGHREGRQNITSRWQEVREYLEQGLAFPGYEQFLPFFMAQKFSLLDYFQAKPLILFDEPNRQQESRLIREKDGEETYKILLEKGRVFPSQFHNYFTWEEMGSALARFQKVYFSMLPQKTANMESAKPLGIMTKTPNLFMGKTKLLVDEIREWRRQKYVILIVVNTAERADRLRQSLWDSGVEAVIIQEETMPQPEQVCITLGYLSSGLEIPGWKLAVLTEYELFHQPRKRLPRKIFQEGKRINILEDLRIGDYVVHSNHGIGRYLGIEKLSVGEAERDYLVIKYQGEDKVYVPTDQAVLLQKYAGQEGQVPKLSKLGGNEWNKIKSRVRTAVKDMAEELLAIYAARQSQPGHPFSGDSPWQQEFEDAFPFEETPDQLKSIREVKTDMERARPMDRLLCGDVGYGKTEVAIRAAFKAVSDGKQVAILVPTTVLAQQHYTTFGLRFQGFPVNIKVLSRFRTPKEQKQVLLDLEQGQVDIIIGTHRLLSKDVKFKDLGLLIVDEEQRFGVVHKEKIKLIKKSVDVLTLTATPIPRTLHMSLVGVRDMSVIETPPEDRYPVQTFVVEFSEQLVREAIRRELGRGGQVYYVHNRVEDIEHTASLIQEVVPEAITAIAHGQMTEVQLENIMLNFMEGRIDVLICTTIIESGLDISNVNTLIIDEADKLGLSQLYQIRGRVGRSNRVAYAYLTYKKNKILSEVAEKRLSAIRDFTELGSGFKIAMRDLEIRGSGNILGAEQHGHVAAVGFDLYCRMLEEAVKEVRGEVIPVEKTVLIEMQVKAYIPQDYIQDTGVKIDFYQRIYAAKQEGDIDLLAEEMKDRFGVLPETLQNLLHIARIKTVAAKAKVQSILQENQIVRIKMEEAHGLAGPQLMMLVRRYRRQVSFSTSKGLEILINIGSLDRKQRLTFLKEIIMEISCIAHEDEALV